MSQFLENKYVEYINLIPYLKSLFEKYPLKIITPSEERIKTIVRGKKITEDVMVNDSIITSNLRMIGSYVPEKLAMVGFKSLNESKNLVTLIKEISKERFLYSPPKFAKRVIIYRFINFFEALLFSNFFENIWKGDLISDRRFVIKENNELKYYTLYQSKIISKFLIEKINVKSKVISTDNNIFHICVNFEMTFVQ